MIGPAEGERQTGARDVSRWFDCPHYSKCNSIACKEWWDNFVCDRCELAPWYRPPRPPVCMKPVTPRVPLNVFMSRVVNDPFGRGYTPDNFIIRLNKDIRQQYGEDSMEYAFIRSRLLLLKASVGNDRRDDLSDLRLIAESFSTWFSDVPDIRDVYLSLCGRVWRVRL